ncbi:hypothetical protein BC937DRAFT_95270 [Endogone sp. FLAS-F59071]|nr:hypothetical protein BC937DRAFT_95270 [Endogone sp. FLAS-F59071]|eukprot:RUS13464.1 hypothetical protein BC937DRAFT_95270 [Endogone sp. FLAS-F59071]
MNSSLLAKPSCKAYNWVNLVPKNFDPNTGMQPAQERRRTSLKEQSILEAAFRDSSLPDKQTLKDLSEILSMSTRAVQVWFQNKRQSTRRKETQQVNNSAGKIVDSIAQVTYQEVNQEANIVKLVVTQKTEMNVVHQETLKANQNGQQEVSSVNQNDKQKVNVVNQDNKQKEAKVATQEVSSCSQTSTNLGIAIKPTHFARGACYTKSHITDKTSKPSSPIKRDYDLPINSNTKVLTKAPIKRDRDLGINSATIKMDCKAKYSLSKPPIEEKSSHKQQRASTEVLPPSPLLPLPLLSNEKHSQSEPLTEEEESSCKQQRVLTQTLLPLPPSPSLLPNRKCKRLNKVLTPDDDNNSEKENIAPHSYIHRPKCQRNSRSLHMPMTTLNEATLYPDLSDIIPSPADMTYVADIPNMSLLYMLMPPAICDTPDNNIPETADMPLLDVLTPPAIYDIPNNNIPKKADIPLLDIVMPLVICNTPDNNITEVTNMPLLDILVPPAVHNTSDDTIFKTAKIFKTPTKNEILRETIEENDISKFEALLLLAETAVKQEEISRLELLKSLSEVVEK